MFLWLFGLVFLIIFSIIDLHKGEVSNASIIFYLITGTYFIIGTGYFFHLIIAGMMFLFSYLLWKKDIIGGADAKILTGLPLFWEIVNRQELLLGVILFIIIFAIVGTIYSLVYKFFSKKRKIPFIPAIAIAYFIFAFIQMIIK